MPRCNVQLRTIIRTGAKKTSNTARRNKECFYIRAHIDKEGTLDVPTINEMTKLVPKRGE